MPYTPQSAEDKSAGTKAAADEAHRQEQLRQAEREAQTAARFEHG